MNNFTNRLIEKKFGVFFDDGAHHTMLEEFDTEDEAWVFYRAQIEAFKSGTDDYYKQFISDDYDAIIEIAKWNEEDDFYSDTIEEWSKDGGTVDDIRYND